MVKYKLLNHVHEWDGDCYLSDYPSDGYMPTIKKASGARQFYSNLEKEVESILDLWNLEFEKIGESENPPRVKMKG